MKRLILTTIVLALLATTAAEARTVRSPIVLAPTGTCMLRIGGWIGCFGDAVPIEHGADGYLWMRKRGRVGMAENGGAIGITDKRPVRLRRGDRWRFRGVTCRVNRGMKCWNGQHGFRLTKRSYRIW